MAGRGRKSTRVLQEERRHMFSIRRAQQETRLRTLIEKDITAAEQMGRELLDAEGGALSATLLWKMFKIPCLKREAWERWIAQCISRGEVSDLAYVMGFGDAEVERWCWEKILEIQPTPMLLVNIMNYAYHDYNRDYADDCLALLPDTVERATMDQLREVVGYQSGNPYSPRLKEVLASAQELARGRLAQEKLSIR